jgi:hypothetical protein
MAEENKILIEVDIDVDKSIERQIELKDAIVAQKKALDDLKNTAGENTAEYIKANAEYKALQGELKENERLTLNAVRANNQNEGSIKQLRSQLAVVSEKWAALSENERLNTDVGKKLSQQKLVLTERLKQEERATGDARRNVGNYNEVLKDLSPTYSNVENKAKSFIGTIGKLGPVGAIVAAGIAAVSAPLVAFFTKSEKGAEMLERKLAGIGAAFGVLTGKLIGAGEKMADSFDKPEEKASSFYSKLLTFIGSAFGSGVQASFAATGAQMDVASDAAEKYTAILQDLEDLERGMIVPRAEANKKIAEAKLLYEDENQSIETRIQSLKDSLNIELQTVQTEIDYQNKVIAQIKLVNAEKDKAKQLGDDEKKKLEEAIAKRINLETDSMIKQKKLLSTINSAEKQLNDERNKRIEEQKKKQQELADANVRNFEAYLDNIIATQKDADDKLIAELERIREVRVVDLDNSLAIYQDNQFAILDIERARLDLQEKEELEAAEKRGYDTTLIYAKFQQARLELDKAERDAKIAIYNDIASNLVTAFGESTAIGKTAAVAQATFATYQSANAAYASAATVPFVGPVLAPIAAAAAIAAGLANVKKILSVKTPSGGGGGGSVGSANIGTSGGAPVAPQIQNVNSQIGQGIASRDNANLGNSQKIQLQPTLVEDDVAAAQRKSNLKTTVGTI